MLLRPPQITQQNQNLSHIHTQSDARQSSRSKNKPKTKQTSLTMRRPSANTGKQSQERERERERRQPDNVSVQSHGSARSKRSKKKENSIGAVRYNIQGINKMSNAMNQNIENNQEQEDIQVLNYQTGNISPERGNNFYPVEYSEIKYDYQQVTNKYQPNVYENRSPNIINNPIKTQIRSQKPVQNFKDSIDDDIPVVKLVQNKRNNPMVNNNVQMNNLTSPKIAQRQQTRKLGQLFEEHRRNSTQNQSQLGISVVPSQINSNSSVLGGESRRSRSKLGQLFKQRNSREKEIGNSSRLNENSRIPEQSQIHPLGNRSKEKQTVNRNQIPQKILDQSINQFDVGQDFNKSDLNLSMSKNSPFTSKVGQNVNTSINKDSVCFNLEPERKKKGLGVASKEVKNTNDDMMKIPGNLQSKNIYQSENQDYANDFINLSGNLVSKQLNAHQKLRANIQQNERYLMESGAMGYQVQANNNAISLAKQQEMRRKQQMIKVKQRELQREQMAIQQRNRQQKLRLQQQKQAFRQKQQEWKRMQQTKKQEQRLRLEERKRQEERQAQQKRKVQQQAKKLKIQKERQIQKQKQIQTQRQIQTQKQRQIALEKEREMQRRRQQERKRHQQEQLRRQQQQKQQRQRQLSQRQKLRQEEQQRVKLEKQKLKKAYSNDKELPYNQSKEGEKSLIYSLEQDPNRQRNNEENINSLERLPSTFSREHSSKGSQKSEGSRKSNKKKQSTIPVKGKSKKLYGEMSPRAQASFYEQSRPQQSEDLSQTAKLSQQAPRNIMSFNDDEDLTYQPKIQYKTDTYFYDKSIKAPSSKPPLSRKSSNSKGKVKQSAIEKKSKDSQIKIRNNDSNGGGKKLSLVELAMRKNYEGSGSEYQSQDSFHSRQNSVQSYGSRNSGQRSTNSKGSRKKQSVINIKQKSLPKNSNPPYYRRISPQNDIMSRTLQHEKQMARQASSRQREEREQRTRIIKDCSFIDQRGRLVSRGNMIIRGNQITGNSDAKFNERTLFQKLMNSREKRRSRSRQRSLRGSRASSRSIEKLDSRNFRVNNRQFVESEAYSEIENVGRYESSGSNFYGNQRSTYQNYNRESRTNFGNSNYRPAPQTLQEFIKPIQHQEIRKYQKNNNQPTKYYNNYQQQIAQRDASTKKKTMQRTQGRKY